MRNAYADPEKYLESLRLGEGDGRDGEERGCAAVEDGRADGGQGEGGRVLGRGRRRQVGEGDVGGVVDADAHRHDEVDGGDDVDLGGGPEQVEEAGRVHQGEEDGEGDGDGGGEVAQEDEGDEEDAAKGQQQVAEELEANQPVDLPRNIKLQQGGGRIGT